MREHAGIDFWFTMGSTYTYLSVMRVEDAARSAGIPVRWRVFASVRALTGATQVPFIEGTPKFRYMWRDIERRAQRLGVPCRLPVPYPSPAALDANRIALIGIRDGWGPAYVRAAYQRWFEFGDANGTERNSRVALAACGRNFDAVVARASSTDVIDELEAQTAEARQGGVFGSPTFVVGKELFWGDDHLEDAIAWADSAR
jgi:2-hydroxychromene-2-carboxylate isomerase